MEEEIKTTKEENKNEKKKENKQCDCP